MANSIINSNTELRKLQPAHKYALAEILNVSDSWKQLMAIIPRDDTNAPRFNSEHISIIDQVAEKHRENGAKILLEEWSTMGRLRPTLGILLNLLIEAELFRAADYVAGEILKVDLPKRPEYGPAAIIDISDNTLAKLMHDKIQLNNNENGKLSQTVESLSSSSSSSSCRVNVGEIIHFSNVADLMDPCLIRNNTESMETLGKCNAKKEDIHLVANDIIISSVDNVNKDLEVSSKELPLFLQNFGQIENLNESVQSHEIPVFVNGSAFVSDKSVIKSNDDNRTNITNMDNTSSSTSYNFDLTNREDREGSMNCQFQSEVMSSLLPQFVNDWTNKNT
ncbi:PREDICTED: uncharacterized protein LOC107071321 [Polistes dominula]|uniref:Uncharacterized protein LOC107071321 n=1 Tax=Polistes dominula TaxID=743375 RepID=A0ABM1IZS0_POLDO|nr:PREDICTED: uncharacterized protein LOC107071321 [Polistes dominula]